MLDNESTLNTYFRILSTFQGLSRRKLYFPVSSQYGRGDSRSYFINTCSNRNPKRILYCPQKSQLKYTQWSKVMTESFKSQGISHANMQKKHIFPQRSVHLLQLQNTETKLNTE